MNREAAPIAVMATERTPEVGWTSIDGVRVPYVIRNSRKFVSVRLLEETLLANYQHVSDDELRRRAPLVSFFMTPPEARALNGATCGGYSEHDLIVQLVDFVQFYSEVKARYGQLSNGSCSWIQLNSTVMPYIVADGRRQVPLSVVRHAAKLLQGLVVESRSATADERQQLTAMCEKAKIPFHFSDSTQLVSINVVVAQSDTKVTVFDLPGENPLAHAYYEYVVETSEPPVPLLSSSLVSVDRTMQKTPAAPADRVNLCPPLKMQYPALGQMLSQDTPPGHTVPPSSRTGPLTTTENRTLIAGEPAHEPLRTKSKPGRVNAHKHSSPVFGLQSPNVVVVPATRQLGSPDGAVLESYPRSLPPADQRVATMPANATRPSSAGTPAVKWSGGCLPYCKDILKPDVPAHQQLSRKGVQAAVSPPHAYVYITHNPVLERDFQTQLLQHHKDQQQQTTTKKVFADSQCGQIVPVVIHSKTVTCLVNGSGRWVLVEVIARVFFPHVAIPNVQHALLKILGAELPVITPEQEMMFIQFYRLKTTALAFNTVVRVRNLAHCLPQLQILFPEQQRLQQRKQQQLNSPPTFPAAAAKPVGYRLQSPTSESDSGISVATTDCSDSVESADVSNVVLDLSAPLKRKGEPQQDNDTQLRVKRLRAGIEDAVAKLRVKQAFVT